MAVFASKKRSFFRAAKVQLLIDVCNSIRQIYLLFSVFTLNRSPLPLHLKNQYVKDLFYSPQRYKILILSQHQINKIFTAFGVSFPLCSTI